MNKIIKFKTISSTNDYIKKNFVDLEDSTIVVSNEQTSGRGRSDHTWKSEIGNLYMSLLKKNDLTHDSFFFEMIQISMSIVELLKRFDIKSKIKYPNDILVNNKKICGILIESKWSDSIDYLILGMGINVNQIDFQELNFKATSIQLESGLEVKLDDVLMMFLDIYNNNTFELQDYIENSMIIGKMINYNDELCKVIGISKEGYLLLKSEQDEYRVKMNEISLEEIYDEINN